MPSLPAKRTRSTRTATSASITPDSTLANVRCDAAQLDMQAGQRRLLASAW